MFEILQKGNKILEKKAKEIILENISGSEIKNIISEMKDIIKNTNDAVALSSPQIGKSLRIFIVSKKIFNDEENNDHLVFINPKIIKTSKDKAWLEEGF